MNEFPVGAFTVALSSCEEGKAVLQLFIRCNLQLLSLSPSPPHCRLMRKAEVADSTLPPPTETPSRQPIAGQTKASISSKADPVGRGEKKRYWGCNCLNSIPSWADSLTFDDDGLGGGGGEGNGVFVVASGAESIGLVHLPGKGSEGGQPQVQGGVHAETGDTL